jgi:hypothetical protein
MIYQNEKVIGIYSVKDQLQTTNLFDQIELSNQLEQALKAMIQTYNHALINNKMTIK